MTCLARAATTCWAAVLITLGVAGAPGKVAAQTAGPFEEFAGTWSGEGTITLGDGNKERLRCTAGYQVRSAAASGVDLRLGCTSDNYKFNFTGSVEADPKGTLSGSWTETSRNIGGIIAGRARGDQMQVYVQSANFNADLSILTRSGRQTVSIRSRGGGETATATIALRRQGR